MRPIRKWGLYTLYIIVIALVCLYLLFPSDAVSRYISRRIHDADNRFDVSIARVKPAFPPGLRLSDINIKQGPLRLIAIQTLKVVPAYTTLLSPTKAVAFKGKSHGGTLKGEATFAPERFGLQTDFSGMSLREIPAVKQFVLGSISGRLDGQVSYTQSGGAGESVTANLRIQDCRIDLKEPLFNMPQLEFKQVELETGFTADQFLIRRCVISGYQLGGTLSGSVRLADTYAESLLDLHGTLKFHHRTLAQLGQRLTKFLAQGRAGKDQGLAFRISGTLAQPLFAFN